MSGIAGILNLDGRPVENSDLWQMVSMLKRRGPDGSNVWHDGSVGFGQTMLVTTPEASHERLPHISVHGDLVIIADARLDNRDELIAVLGYQDREQDKLGDSELILGAYQKWGEACPEKLLGDFAFAVWDSKQQKLFCARDHFGVRPFYYYHDPGRIFVFASEPRAILVLKQIPYRINEGRIADFLISQLEGIDKTSTFFEDVFRLPPAQSLSITRATMRQQQYWALEPGPELKLPSDEAYAEAFLEVFTEAVRCRLRGKGMVGSMLSGGMDSGSIVAVARELLAEKGLGPLPVFSGVAPDPETCVESQTIFAALKMEGLDSHIVNYGDWNDLLPELVELTWSLDEPFDNHMTLPRVIYLAAHRSGTKALLDGIDGDNVLSEGSHIIRLLQRGHWLTAYREARGQDSFWGGAYPAGQELFKGACHAFVPEPVWRLRRAMLSRRSQGRLEKNIEKSIMNWQFVDRIRLGERLNILGPNESRRIFPDYQQERIRAIAHPYLTVGVERYNRVASAMAVEPRHPFLDRRVVEFCITLPGGQKLNQGWPKAILRRSMAGKIPDQVRWRKGKEHLGWAFTAKLMETMQEQLQLAIMKNMEILSNYVNKVSVHKACLSYFDDKNLDQGEKVYEAAHLAMWLSLHRNRPQVETQTYDASFSFPNQKREETCLR
jgi:asparagine synthase (glutamine-hydrolysing)